MKQWVTAVAAAGILCVGVGGAAGEPASTNKPATVQGDAGAEHAMGGKFTWNGKKGQKHDLKAVFKSTGADSWDVEFKAKWGNKDVTFKGTTKGNLKSGEITGEAKDAGGKRTWTFKGVVKDGSMECKHTETSKGKETPTGDFSLKKA